MSIHTVCTIPKGFKDERDGVIWKPRLAPWKCESLSHIPCSVAGKSKESSSILSSWQGAKIHQNILLFEALQKMICCYSITSWFQQSSCGLQWNIMGTVSLDVPMRRWSPGLLSSGQLAVRSIPEWNTSIRSGSIFKIFKYPHKSKNMTFCDCKISRLCFFFNYNLNVESFPVNWF